MPHPRELRTHNARLRALKAGCKAAGIDGIDSERVAALEPVVKRWLSGLPTEIDAVERLRCLKDLLDDDRTLPIAGAAKGTDRSRWLLELIGHEGLIDLPPLPKRGWPPPLHHRVTDLKTIAGGQHQFGHFTSLFEAFLHLHFVVVASQFLHLVGKRDATPPEPLTAYGLRIVQAALHDDKCDGGRVLLQRALGLSCAGQAIVAGSPPPFPHLFSLLDPAGAEPKLDYDSDRAKCHWPMSSLSPTAKALSLWPDIRNPEFGHTDVPTAVLPKDILHGALRLKDLLGQVFAPYRSLRMAYVTVTSNGICIIQGHWDEASDYLDWSNPDNQAELATTWGEPRDGNLPAPPPPRLSDHWDGSLLLYDPTAPRERFLYLMPLGYRYENRRTDELLPALTYSVRWRRRAHGPGSEVHWIDQRAYVQPDESPHGFAETLEQGLSPAGGRAAPGAIEQIAALIADRYGLPSPPQAGIAVSLPLSFELDHLRHARALAHESVPRPDEVARLLGLTRAAPERRLLLCGASASGKSVLLAQVTEHLRAKGAPLIYLSMDEPPDPEDDPDAARASPGLGDPVRPRLFQPDNGPTSFDSGLQTSDRQADLSATSSAKTIAGPVRMHLLATLLRLAGRIDEAPSHTLGVDSTRHRIQALVESLAPSPDAEPVWLLIDALDQSPEPGALLAGLPRPLPTGLRVIATTRPIDRVILAVEDGDHARWARANLNAIATHQLQAFVLHDWPAADRAALGDGLPQALLDDIQARSGDLPLLLRAWGKDLLQRWQQAGADPAVFDIFRRLLAERDSRSLPDDYRRRLDAARQGFDPAALPDLLLWTLTLMERPLALVPLQQATDLLRPHFPALRPCSKDDIRRALGRLGGFLARTGTDLDPRWRLGHPMLGAWFIDLHGTEALRSTLRDALAPLGAFPDLDDQMSMAAWATRVLDNAPAFKRLTPDQRRALLQRLLDGLPDGQRPLPELENSSHRSAYLMVLLASELHQSGDFEQAARLADKARDMAERRLGNVAAEQQLDVGSDLASAWSTIGICRWSTGDKEGAFSAYDTALSMFVALSDEHRNIWDWRRALRLATAYMNRGIILTQLEREDEALDDWERALHLGEGIDSNQPDVQERLADIYAHRATILARRSRYEDAAKDFDHSIELRSELDPHDPKVCNRLADSFVKRGHSFHGLQRYEAALDDYGKAIEVYAVLDPIEPDARGSLASAYCYRANTCGELERHDAAVDDYSQAIALLSKLDLNQPETLSFLASTYAARAEQLVRIERADAAAKDKRKSIELYSKLANQKPRSSAFLAQTYISRGKLLLDLGEQDAAMNDYNHVVALLTHSEQGSFEHYELLAQCYEERGFVLNSFGHFDEALEDCNRLIALILECGKTDEDALRKLARSFYNRGLVRRRLRNQTLEAALEDFGWAVDIYSELDPQQSDVRFDLIAAYGNESNTLLDLGWTAEAAAGYSKVIALLSELDQDNLLVRVYSAEAFRFRGIALASLHSNDEAFENFGRSIDLYVAMMTDSTETRRNLATVYSDRAAALMALDRCEEALEDYDKALQFYTLPEKQNPRLSEALAAIYLSRGIERWRLNRLDAAMEDFNETIALISGLEQEDRSDFGLETLAQANENRGALLEQSEDWEAVQDAYGCVVELRSGVDQPEPDACKRLAAAHRARGNALSKLGRHQSAVKEFDSAIKLYGELDMGNPDLVWDLASIHGERSYALVDMERVEAAVKDLKEAAVLLTTLDQEQPHVRRYLAATFRLRASHLNGLERHQAAVGDLSEVISLYTGLHQDNPKDFKALAEAYVDRGDELLYLDRQEAALDDYNQAIELLSTLDQQHSEACESLARAYYQRGMVLEKRKRYKEAMSDYGQTIELLSGLDEAKEHVRKRLADAYHKRANASAKIEGFDLGFFRDFRHASQLDGQPCKSGGKMVVASVLGAVLGAIAWQWDAPWIAFWIYSAGSAIGFWLGNQAAARREICTSAVLIMLLAWVPWLLLLLLIAVPYGLISLLVKRVKRNKQ